MKFIQKVTENASNLYLYLNCTIVTIITYYWFGAVHSWLERVGNFANDTFQMHEHNVQSGRGLSDHNITSRFFSKVNAVYSPVHTKTMSADCFQIFPLSKYSKKRFHRILDIVSVWSGGENATKSLCFQMKKGTQHNMAIVGLRVIKRLTFQNGSSLLLGFLPDT